MRHAFAQTGPDVRVVRNELRVLKKTSEIIADEKHEHWMFRTRRRNPQRNLVKVRTFAIDEPDPFAKRFDMDHFIFSDTINEK